MFISFIYNQTTHPTTPHLMPLTICITLSCSGGIQFGIDGSQYASIEQSSVFCTAWMINLVSDDSDKPGLIFKTEPVELKVEDITYTIHVPCLVANTDVFCNVRDQDNGRFAVLKRGLLYLDCQL